MENVITINATLRKKATLTALADTIYAQVFCKDNYAVASFSDNKFAKKLYKQQVRKGKSVIYNEKLNLVIERYNGKTAKEIAEIISLELKKSGGELQQ